MPHDLFFVLAFILLHALFLAREEQISELKAFGNNLNIVVSELKAFGNCLNIAEMNCQAFVLV